MNGLNPPGDRRLFFLWFILGLIFFCLYYVWPQPTLVERFEKAYYSFYWARPLLIPADKTESKLAVGVILPAHISSLVDTEMWVWMQNTDEKLLSGEPPSPAIAIDYTITAATMTPPAMATAAPDAEVASTPAPPMMLTPSPAESPTPVATTIAPCDETQAAASISDSPFPEVAAHILFRQGNNRTDLNTDSQGKVVFTNLYPNETAAQVIWTRLMPVALRDINDDEVTYLGDENVIGYVDFNFTFWPDVKKPTNSVALVIDPSPVRIDNIQTVLRGLVRTLLLPPWANGVLIALALLCASLLNNLPHPIEQRLHERAEAHQKGAAATEPVYPTSWRGWLCYPAKTHLSTLFIQFVYWLGVIKLTVYVVLFLTERLILHPLLVACWNKDEWRRFGCPWWPVLLLLTVVTFYCGYILPDRTPGSFHETVMHARRSSGNWLRNKQGKRQRMLDNLLGQAEDLHRTIEGAVPPFSGLPQQRQSYEALLADRQKLADMPAERLDERLSGLRRWLDEMERYTALKNEFDALRPSVNAGEAEAGAELTALRARLEFETFTNPAVKSAAETLAKDVRRAARNFARRGEKKRYNTLKNEFDALRPKAKDGDAETGAALTALRTRLESETFTSPSIKKAAEAMANDIDRAARGFALYFEKPCQCPAHEATLRLQALGKRPVRFFTSPNLDERAQAIMRADEALPIATVRAESAMSAVQQQLHDAETDLRRILATPNRGQRAALHLLGLELTLAEWPNGLRHWHDIAPQAQPELAAQIAQLQEDVRAAR